MSVTLAQTATSSLSPLATLLILTSLAGLAMPAGAFLARIERLRPRWLEQEFRHAVVAFGGGVLLAGVALVLVPEGARALSWPKAALLFAGGGILFMLLDAFLARRTGSAAQLVAMLADFIPEAIALGATFAVDSSVGVLLALLIALQNLPEGFNAYRELMDGGRLSGSRIIIAFIFMAGLGPLCGFAGFVWLADAPATVGAVMMAAAGGILYLTFEDIAPQARLDNQRAPALGAVAGFLVGMIGHMVLVG